jgi:hypothetical protein
MLLRRSLVLPPFSKSSRYVLRFPLIATQANGSYAQEVLASIGCSGYGQEAGLEAIRMALDGLDSMEQGCDDLDGCEITWRSGSKRIIIMITDEDSDLPTNP